MSVQDDRAGIAAVLRQALAPLKIEGLDYAPGTVRAGIAWLDLSEIQAPENQTFAHKKMRTTWRVTITVSATLTVIEAQKQLDAALDAAMSAIVASGAADVETAGEYFGITETSGATFPAVRLTLSSIIDI